MKELKAILTGLVVFTIFYLLGAFAQNNFNITYWSCGTRETVSLVGGCISLFIVMVKYANDLDYSK